MYMGIYLLNIHLSSSPVKSEGQRSCLARSMGHTVGGQRVGWIYSAILKRCVGNSVFLKCIKAPKLVNDLILKSTMAEFKVTL